MDFAICLKFYHKIFRHFALLTLKIRGKLHRLKIIPKNGAFEALQEKPPKPSGSISQFIMSSLILTANEGLIKVECKQCNWCHGEK